MFQLQENGVIDCNIDGFELNLNTFEYLKVLQQSDLILPMFELSINIDDYSIISNINKNNTPIKISFGKSISDIVEYEFLINNYTLNIKGDKYNCILYGILDLKDYYTIQLQKSFKDMTTDTLLSMLEHITPDIDYVGDDSQIWIRHNITEKDWVRRLTKNAYISDDDFPLSAITISKKLIVKSVKKLLSSNPKFTFYNQPQGQSSD